MTTLKSYSEDILQVKDRLNKELKHPYLMKFIDPPVVDEDKVIFLYTMLQENHVSKERIHDCVIPTLLVQAALDTHERVSLHTISTNLIKKNRQLTVLAGDYYSSLYYHLLAKIDDISMIRLLAASIQEINESKMNLYKNKHYSLTEVFDDVRMIESDLLQKIAEYYGLTNWKKAIGEFFLLKRLLAEKGAIINNDEYGSLANRIYAEHFKSKNKISLIRTPQQEQFIQMCDVYIEKSREQLLNVLQPYQSWHSLITDRIEQLYTDHGLIKQKVAEEG